MSRPSIGRTEPDHADFRLPGTAEGWLLGLAGWMAVFSLCVATMPEMASLTLLLPLGAVALWRWLWIALQLMRASAYLRFVFPAYRRAAAGNDRPVEDVGVVCTSYRMDPRVSGSVARSLRADIEDLNPKRACVVFSVGDQDDAEAIRQAFLGADRIDLTILFQDGSGKRRAVADALSALRSRGVTPGGVVLLMDGDTLIPAGTLRRTVPILRSSPGIGALTVHNRPFVDGSAWARDWYLLRMIQRHVQMSSVSLSERVLVLTGRWSLYRAELALHPDFAAQVAHDVLHHRREGSIPLLTGEDKSTWRWIIERGYRAIYVPDVAVHPLEKLPGTGFFKPSVALMRRWFGNMSRGGLKAIPLGPAKLGWFPWLVLLDQRVSMWTTLSGPLFMLSAALLSGTPRLIAAYGLWALLSRTAHSLAIGALARSWTPSFPFLMYYTQVVGALVKIHVTFHPAQQKWTRQGTGATGRSSPLSTALMTVAVMLFACAVLYASGTLAALP